MKSVVLFLVMILLPNGESQSIDNLSSTTNAIHPSPLPTLTPGRDAPTSSVTHIRSATSTTSLSSTPSLSSTTLSAHSTTSSSSSTATPTPTSNLSDTNLLLTQLKFIYIIAGVIMFLVLVIIVLLVTVGMLCQRKSRDRRKQKKKKSPQPRLPPGPSQTVSPVNVPLPSPKRKTDNMKTGSHGRKKSQESMSDFPLLCRVLQDYDSPQHLVQGQQNSNELELSVTSNNSSSYHIRIPSGNSSDLEASVRTTASYISQDSNDYDELDSIINVLKNEGASPPKSPLKTLPKTSKAMHSKPLGSVEEEAPELIDTFGYHKIHIRKQSSDDMKRSQSANDIFDDPKYHKLAKVPPPHHLITNDAQHSALLLYTPQSPLMMKHSLTVPEMDATFDKQEHKEYMSLQQVLDLVNTKLSPSRETSIEMDGSDENEELYCPRLLRPVAMDTPKSQAN